MDLPSSKPVTFVVRARQREPWLPLVTPKLIDFVSRRVGNYQYSPVWGMLIDQLWVR
jgi:peptide/nickel transport system substrate-binding protein